MSDITTEKTSCTKCEAEVRENTTFCYNCGTRVTPKEALEDRPGGQKNGDETNAALDDLADKLKIPDTDFDTFAKAAAERKKARINRRKPKEYVWEPTDDGSTVRVVLLAILVGALALVVVLLTVYWK
ncbi:MAG: zinc-ribbon domain-containing protein [Pyrinomonadaceae bacterium]